jgi:FkbM family methyltransferase
MRKQITQTNFFSTFIKNKYRDLILKPALKLIINHQKYPTFWTMPHDTICRTILLDGFYEQALLQGMCKLSSGSDGLALDIGANIGNHSIYFSQYFKKVMAFEPVPSNCWILKANLYLNNIKNVELHECGLSNHNHEMIVMSDVGHNTNNSLKKLSEENNPNETIVNAYSGDALLERISPKEKIILVKIDVEGHEPQVIEGLKCTLKTHKPLIFWEAFSLETFNQSRIFLEDIGYKYFYHLSTNKYSIKWINKIFKSFNSATYLKNIDSLDFSGMNVASFTPLH